MRNYLIFLILISVVSLLSAGTKIEKVVVLNELSESYQEISARKSIEYAQIALQLSRESSIDIWATYTAGHQILKRIDFPDEIAEIVFQHHETMVGKGYPRGFKGSEILNEARILRIADVVEAIAEIEEHNNGRYDPEICEICIDLFRNQNFEIKSASCVIQREQNKIIVQEKLIETNLS